MYLYNKTLIVRKSVVSLSSIELMEGKRSNLKGGLQESVLIVRQSKTAADNLGTFDRCLS